MNAQEAGSESQQRSARWQIMLLGVVFAGLLLALLLGQPPLLRVISENNTPRVVQLDTLSQGTIEKMVWSPDTNTLAVGTSIGIWLYNTQDIHARPRFLDGHHSALLNFAFSLDGTQLISGDHYNVSLWDVATGEQLAVAGLSGQRINSIIFSDDLSKVAFTSQLPTGPTALTVWDVLTDTHITDIPMPFSTVAFNHDGQLIVAHPTPDENGVMAFVQLEDAMTGDVLNTYEYREAEQSPRLQINLFFNAESTFLMRWDTDPYVPREFDQLYLWNIQTGEERTIQAELFRDVILSHNQSTLGFISWVGAIQLLDVQSGVVFKQIPVTRWPVTYAFSPDDRSLAVIVDDSLQLWDVETATQIDTASLIYSTGVVYDLQFTPDGSTLVAWADGSGGTIFRRWDMTTFSQMPVSRYVYSARGGELNSDATQLILPVPNNIILFDIESSTATPIYVNPCDFAATPVFSPDGTLFALTTCTGTRTPAELVVWDTESMTQVAALLINDLRPSRIAFGPGQTLVAHVDNDTILLWNFETEQQIEFSGWDFKFNADRSLMATWDTRGNAIRIWNPVTGEALHHLPIDNNVGITNWEFSPGNMIFAFVAEETDNSSGEGQINFWNISTDQLITSGGLDNEPVISSFNAQGDVFAVAETGGQISLWSPNTGAQLASLVGHKDSVWSLAFSPDGTVLASGGYTGEVRLWGIPAA